MRPSTALLQHRAAIQRATGRFRATNPRVMGSVLHGNDTDASDLDLLVDPMPGATLFDIGGLQDELEELLGVRLDVGRRVICRSACGRRCLLRPGRYDR